MCLQCTGWVFGGYFIHFLVMYLQCTCWVHWPLPPVLVGLEFLGRDEFVVVGRIGDFRHSGRDSCGVDEKKMDGIQ